MGSAMGRVGRVGRVGRLTLGRQNSDGCTSCGRCANLPACCDPDPEKDEVFASMLDPGLVV